MKSSNNDLWCSDFWCFPRGTSGKEPICQCRRSKRHGFSPWIGKIPWRRAWQSTPVFLPGEYQGQRRLVGYSPYHCKQLDTTKQLSTHTQFLMLESSVNHTTEFFFLIGSGSITGSKILFYFFTLFFLFLFFLEWSRWYTTTCMVKVI